MVDTSYFPLNPLVLRPGREFLGVTRACRIVSVKFVPKELFFTVGRRLLKMMKKDSEENCHYYINDVKYDFGQ
jgi:hypothetical protein